MTRIRRKGVAIVESNRGILVVAGRSEIYALPGGGADRGESRRRAAIRELREETGLRTKSSHFLFKYIGRNWHDHRGKEVRNHAKVFLLKTYGRLRSRHEIRYVAWYNPESRIHVSRGSLRLINRYLEEKRGSLSD